MKLMLVLKRRSDLFDADLTERGHGVIRVPGGAWRGPRREVGGMVPRPRFDQIAVAEFERALLAGKAPVVPDGLPHEALVAMVRRLERS